MASPKVTLRVNPITKTAYVKKPLTFKVIKPLQKTAFSPRRPAKLFTRKAPIRKIPSWQQQVFQTVPQFSESFSRKNVKYVAAVICHGISCDRAQHLFCRTPVACDNPLFKPKYDVVFTSKYGATSKIYGNNTSVGKYLYENLKKHNISTGGKFMEILESTIDRGARTRADGEEIGIGGALGKHTMLSQKDIGTAVSDLNIFMEGDHSEYISPNNNDNDSIFLFKLNGDDDDPVDDDYSMGEDEADETVRNNVQDHNVLAVNPTNLLYRRPALRYVAQTAHNLQSLIEPTGAALEPTLDKSVFWSDATHRLKDGRTTVRLSDIIGKEGVFPPDTVVVAYVCRSTLVDDLCALSPTGSDYTSMSHVSSSTPSFGLLDVPPSASGSATPMSDLSLFEIPPGASGSATPMSGLSLFEIPPGASGSATPMSGLSLFEISDTSDFDPDDPSWMPGGGAMKKGKNMKSRKKRTRGLVNIARRRSRRARARP
jgi:hypothetical protein